jgi:enoyl-CoA hydratase/carnithine racemase
MMAGRLVEVGKDKGIAVVTLNDPPANAYSYEMMRQLDEAILEARLDDEIAVLVVRGAGDRFFCAGANIRMLQEVTPSFKYYFCLHAHETLNRLEQTPKLTIAALNGHTMGGGLEVAMACDLRLAWQPPEGHRGFQYGLPEVSLGVLPGTGGTQRFPRLVRKDLAILHMTSGKGVSLEEAERLGLVTQRIPAPTADEFMAKVLDFARGYCPPAKASKAVGAIKRAVQSGLECGFAEGLAIERELQQQLFLSDDAKEGLGAYTEKRTPSFTGR